MLRTNRVLMATDLANAGGIGKPVFHTALRARGCDLDPVCELPYGPAANDRPHQRPNRCQHLTTRDTNLKISLAPTEASTDAKTARPAHRSKRRPSRR